MVIGGKANMWGEHVDASNFFARVWPRTSVLVRLPSGAPQPPPPTHTHTPLRSRLCFMFVVDAFPSWCGYRAPPSPPPATHTHNASISFCFMLMLFRFDSVPRLPLSL